MFEADRGTAGNRWPVVRIRAGNETRFMLLSLEYFALTVHWVGHSVPCAGDGCCLCETLVGRGLFYLAGMCQGRVSIVELGAQSSTHLEQHLKLLHNGFVPGLEIRLLRRSAKSPVYGEVVGRVEGCNVVPRFELARRVLALYKFPPCNPNEPWESYETRIAAMARRRNEQISLRLQQRSESGVPGR